MVYWSAMTEEEVKCRVEEDPDDAEEADAPAVAHG
jgi:hypothetical protein